MDADLKEEIKAKVLAEIWKGARPTGTPSPPFRRAAGAPSTVTSAPKKYWKDDVLNVRHPGYQKLNAEQKMQVFKHGDKLYDIYGNGGHKNYIKVGDLPKGKNAASIKKINAEIGKAEGKAAANNAAFWEGKKRADKQKTGAIAINYKGKDKEQQLLDKGDEAVQWYERNVILQRYKAKILARLRDAMISGKIR